MNVEGTEPFDVNAVILSRMRLPLQPLSTIRRPAIHHNLIYVTPRSDVTRCMATRPDPPRAGVPSASLGRASRGGAPLLPLGSSGTFLPVEGIHHDQAVKYDDVSLIYPGGTKPAVAQLDLDIADGEFLVLVGPSGCGKSTSLRMLAGLEPISSGTIYIGDRDVTHVPAKDRDIAMVFQNYALYPHMSVAREHGLRPQDPEGLQGRDRPPRQGRRRAARPHRVPRPQAEGPVRRPAPARGHGPRHRPRARGVPHGRAAVEPRRQAPRADPHPDRRAAAPPRHHHALRHARPGRGHDHGRPRRGAQGRHPAAVRLARASCTTTRPTSSSAASSAPRR